MSTGKLWVASVSFEFVVLASGAKEAEIVAGRFAVEDLEAQLFNGAAVVDGVRSLTSLAALPSQWDGTCIPWGEEDDRTCAEILGGKVAP